MIPLVTYHAYLQISKMADNLIFLIKICQIWKKKFYNKLLDIVSESLSNETINIFVAIFYQAYLIASKICSNNAMTIIY